MLMLPLLALLAQDAPPAPQESDLRCVAVLSAAVDGVPEQARGGVIAGIMYFIGRLEGRDPGFDLEAGMTGLLRADVPPEQARADLERCGAIMQARGEALVRLGGRLQGME